MFRSRPLAPLFVACLMIAGAFAGCLGAETSQGAALSRVHTLTFSKDTMERAEAFEDEPMKALREILRTDLVVRVDAAGDYTVEYTDASGQQVTKALTGLTPGTPTTITGADPISPAVLKSGADIVSIRAGVNTTWWHAGDMPLGVTMTPGAKAAYDFRSRVEETLSLQDLDLEDQNAKINSLRFDLRLPIEGRVSWEMGTDAGEGAPVTLAGEFSIPAGAGDIVTLEVDGTMEGQPGTAGVVGGLTEARATGSGRVWIKDGAPVATQFLGGNAKFTPRAIQWATGYFADMSEGTTCAGKTRADACVPEELEPVDETEPAGEREAIDATDLPKAENDQDREALTLIERLFAQDIVAGDKVTLILDVDESLGPDGARAAMVATYSIEAVGNEQVSVPAGKFDALKILEEVRTRVQLQKLPGPGETPVIDDLTIDETVTRTTFWLDSKTYQPLKMTAEFPVDVDAVLKRVVNSIDASAWETLGGKPLQDSQWTVRATASASYEAVEVKPGSQFSALVGLALAHSLSGSGAGAFGSFVGALPGGMSHAEPAYPHDEHGDPYGGPDGGWGSGSDSWSPRPVHLAVSSAGPVTDGVKTYTVSSASEGLEWNRLGILVDDDMLFLEGEPTCGTPETWMFVACRGESGLGYEDAVLNGDSVRLAVTAGQTVKFIDAMTDSVILTMTVN